MPDVGGKKFSYTPEGRKAAKAYSKRTGKAVRTNYRGGKTVAKKRKQRGGRSELTHMAPGVARRQMAGQAAAGGPGRRAASIGGGGWKKGGQVPTYNQLIQDKF